MQLHFTCTDNGDGCKYAIKIEKSGMNDITVYTNDTKASKSLQEWYTTNTTNKVKSSKGNKWAKYIFILDNGRKDSGLGSDTWNLALTDKMLEMGYTTGLAYSSGYNEGKYYLIFVPK